MNVQKITSKFIKGKTIYRADSNSFFDSEWYQDNSLPEVGKKYLVVTRNNTVTDNPECLEWWDDEEMIDDGFPGNMDSSIRRFHGWRGTTNNVAVYAHGVRECIKFSEKEYKKTAHRIVEFGADLTIDRD